MSVDIKRALIDEAYRKTLTAEELAQLPKNPAGESLLSEEELDKVAGGRMCQGTMGSCLASKRSSEICGGC